MRAAVSAASLGAVIWAGLPAVVVQASEPAVAAAAPSEGSEALVKAAESGQQVEVVGLRTERSSTYANPDGETFTLEQSVKPIRVAKKGGGWQTPDATLVKQADGTLVPTASAAQLVFSGGGDGALVSITREGRSVSLTWPGGDLPAPVLDGERALYRDVLPDVDLVLTATVEGFHEVLQVNTPEAAADPSLEKLVFPVASHGLRLTESAGGLAATDGQGQTVFRSPAARMWDSAGDTAVPPAVAARSAAAVTAVDVSGGVDIDPLDGPGNGDTTEAMAIKLGSDGITVVPDSGMLTGTDPAHFPLFIDPTIALNESERTVLSSDGDVFWNFDGGDNGMSVGKCGYEVIGGLAYYCTTGTPYTNRMYFEFDPYQLKGKDVRDAYFDITETWSFSCDATWVDLERTNNISSTTKWPGPAKLDQMGDRQVSAGRGSNCSPAQPRATVTYHDNADEPDENLAPTVKSFADGKFTRLTLMLMAKSESDTNSWKRFDDDARLRVVYAAKPALPTKIGLSKGSTTQVCSVDPTKPTITSDPHPALTATPQTVASAAGWDKLTGKSKIVEEVSLRTVMDVESQDPTTKVWTSKADILSPSSGYVVARTRQTALAATLGEGVLNRYRAWTRSYYTGTDYSAGPSNASGTGWCYFRYDGARPKAPTAVPKLPYKACGDVCVPAGGPGQPVTFEIAPAAGEAVSTYRYRFDGGKSDERPGTTKTLTLIPTHEGTISLELEASDTVGYGETTVVEIKVASPPAAVGRYRFTETADTAPADDTGGTSNDPAALAGGAVRNEQGRRGDVTTIDGVETVTEDRALALNGTTAYAATTDPLIDTTKSYSVAAWVKLGNLTKNQTVLSQNGTHRSAFYLGYETSGKWSFRTVNADATADASWSYARSASVRPAQAGVWTHLAAVYNAVDKTILLYVNGVAQGQPVAYTTAWQASGPLQIGRTQWSDTYTDYVGGSVDEVAVWNYAIPQSEAVEEATLLDDDESTDDGESKLPAVELVGSWDPAVATGQSVQDLSAYGRPMTVPSASMLDGEHMNFTGAAGDGATVQGPLVDDSGSFSVSATAQIDPALLKAKPVGYLAQVAGQQTATGSSWSIWFERTADIESAYPNDDTGEFDMLPAGRWHFGRLTADGTGTSVVSSIEVIDGDVTLTGVFDAQAVAPNAPSPGVIRLYRGSDQQDADTVFTAEVGTGSFSAGKGFTSSIWQHQLPGSIGTVNVWAGALRSGI
ncbi:LamG domain-containing protein [Streptomyces sp. NPDC005576]|uniref:LamG domain-containing protein n=1 Tax=unclassified Streptomyces TaxID=2593676 RepID=UPI0033E06616